MSFSKLSPNYKPGDVVYKGEPFVKILPQHLWDKVCANCYKSTVPLKSCVSCKIMQYCSKTCQKNAWPDHKLECPFLRTWNYNSEDYQQQIYFHMIQMIGNTILKIKDRDWKTIKELPTTEDSWGFCEGSDSGSFDDLPSHTGLNLAPMKSDCDLKRCLKAIKADVESYIGKENLPSDEILEEIMGKVHYNSLYLGNLSDNLRFYIRALFIGASKMDHSCIPNSVHSFNGKEVVVRAFKEFPKSERITIENGYTLTKTDISALLGTMEDHENCVKYCHCIDCSQPFGESPLTRIIDQSKATAVLDETNTMLQLIGLLAKYHRPLEHLDLPGRFSKLLAKQEGVLGRTNLSRLRTLNAKALMRDDGPEDVTKTELVELAGAMKEVWGEFFPELLPVYHKLKAICVAQKNIDALMYSRKIAQLNMIVFGHTLNESIDDVEFLGKAIDNL